LENLHEDFKNIRLQRLVACNCQNCLSLVKTGKSPAFYDFIKLKDKISKGKYWEECPNSNYSEVNIGQVLSDVIVGNAANDNLDKNFIYQIKEMGMSINQIKNENKIEMSDFGKASSHSSSQASAEASAN